MPADFAAAFQGTSASNSGAGPSQAGARLFPHGQSKSVTKCLTCDMWQKVDEAIVTDMLCCLPGVQPTPENEDKADDLEPSVKYRGVVNKPPEYGGELDPISFKLHAIEIHQFVPLPNVEAPEFVKALSEGIAATDVSALDKFFGGHVPAGWADPDVTGIPAPTMSDILTGNTQNVAMMSPLVCQLSSQFAKQGFVPGGTQDMTNLESFSRRSPSQPQD